MKSQKRRRSIMKDKRDSELPQSGMSCGYGEIENKARQIIRTCARCAKREVVCVCVCVCPHDALQHVQDILTYAKQTCAYVTHQCGARDYTRSRFICILITAAQRYAAPQRVDFVCSTCMGYADFKFSEDTEVVKQPPLQTFLETHFGVRADALDDIVIDTIPAVTQEVVDCSSSSDDDNDDGGGGGGGEENKCLLSVCRIFAPAYGGEQDE